MSMLSDLDRLEHLHGELLSQAKVLVGLLEQGEEEAFNNAWDQRQLVYKELHGLHHRLAPALARWEEPDNGISAADKENAGKVFRQVRSLGRQLLDIDRKVAELLKARRVELVQELGHYKKSRHARQAYGGGSRRWWGPDKLSRTG